MIDKYLKMDLRKPSGMAAKVLDEFLRATPMVGMGPFFVTAEQRYKVNAQYLCAHAVHESDFGRSRIARNKHNLFGFGAYDADPYKNARTFPAYDNCIYYVAKYIADNYLSPTGKYYNGPSLEGMNVKYATDKGWAAKITHWMIEIDKVKSKLDTLVSFKDTGGHWAEDTIKKAKKLGLMSGYPDGTFKPDQLMTRAELAVVAVELIDLLSK